MAKVILATEGNADGGPITTAGSSGATGVINASGSMEWDTGRAWHGSVSIQVNASSTSGSNYFYQTMSSNSLGVDGYFYFTSLPSVAVGLIQVGVGSTKSLAAGVSSTGKLYLQDSANTFLWTDTANFPINQWVRVSLFATPGAGTGTARLARFTGDSMTPDADSTLLTGRAFNAGPFTQIRWGKVGTGTYSGVFNLDDPAYDLTASGLLSPSVVSVGLTPTAYDGKYVRRLTATKDPSDSLTWSITPTTGVTDITISNTEHWYVIEYAGATQDYIITVTGAPSGQSIADSFTVPVAPASGTVIVTQNISAPKTPQGTIPGTNWG